MNSSALLLATAILILFGGGAGHASDVVAAATVGTRLDALEKKTSFYRNKTVKRQVVYPGNAAPGASRVEATSATCDWIMLPINLAFTAPSDVKVWTTYRLNYSAGTKKFQASFDLSVPSSPGQKCFIDGGVGGTRTGTGSMKFESFCAFAADRGEVVTARMMMGGVMGEVCTKDLTTSFSVDAVSTVVELVKPQ